MIRVFSLIAVAFISASALAQGTLNYDWEKIFESPVNDGHTEGWGVSTDDDGYVYYPYFTDTLNSSYDILCYKFNSSGQMQWSSPFFYNLSGDQFAFVANSASSDLYIGGCDCPILKPECDMLLLKVDKSNGQLLWNEEKAFGPNGYEEMDGLEIMSDGIYCGGWGNTTGSNFNSDIGLWKVNFDGSTQWSDSLGMEGTAEHQDGHFVVDDNYIFAGGMWGGTSFFNLYDGREFLGKFSKSDGSLIDSVLFGPTGSWLNSEDALGMATDGNYLYLTGYSTPTSASDWQIFIAKYDKDLNQQWLHYWGGSGTEAARGIAVKNGIIYIAGTTNSPEFNLQGGFDGVLLLMDTSGNLITYKTYGDANDNEFRDLAFDNDNLYLSGTSGPSLFSNPNPTQAFLIKATASTLTAIDPVVTQNTLVECYPNPARDETTVSFFLHYSSIVTAELFNESGEAVKIFQTDFLQKGAHHLSLPFPDISTGIYFLKISSGDFSEMIKLNVIKNGN